MALSQESFGSMSRFYYHHSPHCLEHNIPNFSLPIFNQSCEELISRHSKLGIRAARTQQENQIQTKFLIVRSSLWFFFFLYLLVISGNCLPWQGISVVFNCVFSLIKWPKVSKWKADYQQQGYFITSFYNVSIYDKVFKALRNMSFCTNAGDFPLPSGWIRRWIIENWNQRGSKSVTDSKQTFFFNWVLVQLQRKLCSVWFSFEPHRGFKVRV